MMRITLHGGPKDGWRYDVDKLPVQVLAETFVARGPHTFGLEAVFGSYLPRYEDALDYDWQPADNEVGE